MKFGGGLANSGTRKF